MGKFVAELDKLYRLRRRELGGELSENENAVLQEELIESWIEQERYDEVIRRIHSEYGHEGGQTELMMLGMVLREKRDAPNIHLLFRGLVSRRSKAFWEFWGKATEGHAGSMHDAACRMASTMESYLDYFVSLKAIGLDEAAELLREEMRVFQDRKRPDKSLAERISQFGMA